MANHKSAIKQMRQSQRRQLRNRYWKSTMRTTIKNVRAAVEARSAEDARTALHTAIRTIDRCASKGVIHKRQASRRISRLSRLVQKLGATRSKRKSR